ncbi:MAG: hypothetical protein CM1200mP1_14060 [Candidatus Neomarinimicrobiota bacterium]|nr:MAG: hypothetical protein CM1200mP1_14060 [Candidatus Neomarinimicrobiota bacterium]
MRFYVFGWSMENILRRPRNNYWPKDIFSVPVNMKRRFEKINSQFGFMYLVRE